VPFGPAYPLDLIVGAAGLIAPAVAPITCPAMSKRTVKRKIRARRKKANHGRKPNTGRG
jgi:hypothetical protein